MLSFFSSLPGAAAQGAIWGIMAVGVFITYKILDLADLTVDGSFGTGGAALVVCTASGMNIYLAMLLSLLAGCAAGFVTGVLHTKFGIPAILAGILTQIALYSVNLRIMSGKANQPLSAMKYRKILLVSLRSINKSLIVCGIFVVVIIALLYWFFGTELGHSLSHRLQSGDGAGKRNKYRHKQDNRLCCIKRYCGAVGRAACAVPGLCRR